MKIKDGFITRKIGDKIVAITVGEHTKDFNGMITLNDTGHFIWKCLEKDTDKESIANEVIKEYDISTADAMAEIDKFIAELEKNGILEK
ncbi:PqqD family protein [uncultured Eubacterium sp.]|uniref:PqqD family protein n=1 Tax=uncultured Eubacterium sp. TaxID=165185 RepID=UPI0025D63A7F|nr:PqqD family protein [uncultured Eubacterium sp.]